MTPNLTPCAIKSIRELQEDSKMFTGMLEDVENYIIENVDPLMISEKQSFQAISHIKGLRSIRNLLNQISQEEGSES